MYTYSVQELRDVFHEVLAGKLPEHGSRWLSQELASLQKGETKSFGAAFVMAPRKTGKEPVQLTDDQRTNLSRIRPGLSVSAWTVDRLSRTSLLLHFPDEPAERYVANIENLFLSAEMNELVALYGALPLLAWPEQWRNRCAEGIRSNIGQVLEAVMCDNPYPSEQLDEPAWNQLILKAIFTQKPLLRISGLRERANPALARSISDFAHERWAAHRTVNPIVWICAERFVDGRIFADVQRLAQSTESAEQKAAALICAATQYEPARLLLAENPRLMEILAEGVTWVTLAHETEPSQV